MLRRSRARLAAAALTAAGLAAVAAMPMEVASAAPTAAAPAAATKGARPSGPNPYLALLPSPGRADVPGWRAYLASQGEKRAVAQARPDGRAAAPAPLLVDEDEPDGMRGSNDRPATAQPVAGFGTARGSRNQARVLGTLSPEAVTLQRIPRSTEDDGSIGKARRTGVGSTRDGVVVPGVIGDGPHGSAGSGSGDFDVYQVRAAGTDSIHVDVDLTAGAELDSVVAVYDAAGTLLALNDDDGESLASALAFRVPAAGTYYVLVSGFFVLPGDPFRSGSGGGAGSEGGYTLSLAVAEADVDMFAVRLRKGDVLGASVDGAAARVAVHDPGPVVEDVHGSEQDATYIYPPQSPLPGGGNAVTEHVADQDGWHYVAVENGSGDYDLTVEAYRPALAASGGVQTIFLDFDGQRLNTGIFGGRGVTTLSPLRAFLGRWGLRNSDLDPLVDAILAEVTENVRADVLARGGNPAAAVRILNSRDHADPWGKPNVSRIIVGGTIEESGIPTIGIAQYIDPGNFSTTDTALVLLDILSDPAGDEASLNTYLRPRSNKVAFVGQAVGNVTAHEAGHFLGSWHVDQFNDRPNLMDQGGNFPVLYGVGADGVGGTADDPDVDFGEDTFNPFEGFTGTEDTLTRLAFGLFGRRTL